MDKNIDGLDIDKLEYLLEMFKSNREILSDKFDMNNYYIDNVTNKYLDEGVELKIDGSMRGCIVGWSRLFPIINEFQTSTINRKLFRFLLGMSKENDLIEDTTPNPVSNTSYIYLTSHLWGLFNKLNTYDHMIYRLEKLISGYEPKDISYEIENELLKENDTACLV